MLKPVLGSRLQLGHPLARGLVGCWLFNEGTGNKVADLSGNKNDGMFQGTSPSWSAGKFGSTVLLPGTDEYIEVDAHANSRNAITVSAWVKNNTATWAAPGVIVSKRSAYILYPTSGQTKIEFICYIDTVYSTSGSYVVPDITIWHNYVGTFDGTTIKIYVDGILRNSADVPGIIDADAGVLCIGRDDGLARYLNGLISDVAICNRALSVADIQSLYRDPFQMFEREPIELWSAANSGAPPGQTVLDYERKIRGVARGVVRGTA